MTKDEWLEVHQSRSVPTMFTVVASSLGFDPSMMRYTDWDTSYFQDLCPGKAGVPSVDLVNETQGVHLTRTICKAPSWAALEYAFSKVHVDRFSFAAVA